MVKTGARTSRRTRCLDPPSITREFHRETYSRVYGRQAGDDRHIPGILRYAGTPLILFSMSSARQRNPGRVTILVKESAGLDFRVNRNERWGPAYT
jgi:hypothetical protein